MQILFMCWRQQLFFVVVFLVTDRERYIFHSIPVSEAERQGPICRCVVRVLCRYRFIVTFCWDSPYWLCFQSDRHCSWNPDASIWWSECEDSRQHGHNSYYVKVMVSSLSIYWQTHTYSHSSDTENFLLLPPDEIHYSQFFCCWCIPLSLEKKHTIAC